MRAPTETISTTASSISDLEIQTEIVEHAPAGACLPHYCPADAGWVAAFHEDFILALENDNPES
jgi:hypothetical protein